MSLFKKRKTAPTPAPRSTDPGVISPYVREALIGRGFAAALREGLQLGAHDWLNAAAEGDPWADGVADEMDEAAQSWSILIFEEEVRPLLAQVEGIELGEPTTVGELLHFERELTSYLRCVMWSNVRFPRLTNPEWLWNDGFGPDDGPGEKAPVLYGWQQRQLRNFAIFLAGTEAGASFTWRQALEFAFEDVLSRSRQLIADCASENAALPESLPYDGS